MPSKTPDMADDEREEADFQKQEEAAGREQLDINATRQAKKEKTIAQDLDELRKLVGQQFYRLLKEGMGKEELVKAAQNVLREEQDNLSAKDVTALANEALRRHATEKQEAEKARIREAIDKGKPEAAGILSTFSSLSPEQHAKILKSGRWTRTLANGTQQILTLGEEGGKLFFTDDTGKKIEGTEDKKFRFTEGLQKGTIPEGIAAGKEFPFNRKGKWYLAKTDGKPNEEGKLVLLLKDTDGKEWRTTCPPENLSVYREISVDANGVLNKSGKPDRYALKYTPRQKKEAPATKGTPASPGATPPSQPAAPATPARPQPAAPDTSAKSAEAPAPPAPQPAAPKEKPAKNEGAASAAPTEDSKELDKKIDRVQAIEDKNVQKVAIEKLIDEEVKKRLGAATSKAAEPTTTAAAPAAPRTNPTEETQSSPSKLKQWFGKMWGGIKKGFEAVFKNRSRYYTLQDCRFKLEEMDSTVSALKGRVKLINYSQSDDRAITGDVESYDPNTRTLTLRRCRLERADGTIEDKDTHKIRWTAATTPMQKSAPASAKSTPVKPAAVPATKATTPPPASTPTDTLARAAVKPAAAPQQPVATPAARVAPVTDGSVTEPAKTAAPETAQPVDLSSLQTVLQGKKVEELIKLKEDFEQLSQGGIQRNSIEGHFERGSAALTAVMSALDKKQGGRILREIERLLARTQFPNLMSVIRTKSSKDQQEIAKAIEEYAEQKGAVYPIPLRSQGIEINSPAGKEIVAAVSDEAGRKNLLKVLRG